MYIQNPSDASKQLAEESLESGQPLYLIRKFHEIDREDRYELVDEYPIDNCGFHRHAGKLSSEGMYLTIYATNIVVTVTRICKNGSIDFKKVGDYSYGFTI